MSYKGFVSIITILIVVLLITGGIIGVGYLSKPRSNVSVNSFSNPATTTIVTENTIATVSKNNLVKVVFVLDGDTIKVLINGETKIVRLIGIDAPETVDPRKPVQCFAQEASNKLKKLLSNQMVRLESDPTQGDLDKYQRLLRYVFLEDGTFINKLMIAEGYAHEYTYLIPYKYQEEFKTAEKTARESQLGLWSPTACNGITNIAAGTSSQTTITTVATTTSTSIVPSITTTTVSKEIICSYNAYNCSDFATHVEAQAVFEYCGGVNNDIHKLDADKDGLACESLP